MHTSQDREPGSCYCHAVLLKALGLGVGWGRAARGMHGSGTPSWQGCPAGGGLPHGECFLALGFELQPVEPCSPHSMRMLWRLWRCAMPSTSHLCLINICPTHCSHTNIIHVSLTFLTDNIFTPLFRVLAVGFWIFVGCSSGCS